MGKRKGTTIKPIQQNASRFIEISKEILSGPIASHLREVSSRFPQVSAAVLFEKFGKLSWGALCGFTCESQVSAARFTKRLNWEDIEGPRAALTRRVNVLDHDSHRVLVEVTLGRTSPSLDEYCSLLAQQISRLLEFSFVLNRYQEIVSGLNYRDLIAIYTHDTSNQNGLLSVLLSDLDLLAKKGQLSRGEAARLIGKANDVAKGVGRSLQSLQRFVYIRHQLRAVGDIVSDLRDAAGLLGGRRVRFEVRMEAGVESARVSGVADAILSTLLQNSLRAVADRRSQSSHIELKCVRSMSRVRFSLADTGLGIESDIVEKLFDPLVSGGHGSGLGLFFARGLAESVGGSLELESTRVGEGSVFLLNLPMKRGG